MRVLLVIICLLTQIFCVTSKDLLTKVNNQKDFESQVLVENGGNITLRCHSPRPWFFCVWESPGWFVVGLLKSFLISHHRFVIRKELKALIFILILFMYLVLKSLKTRTTFEI